MAPKRDLIVGYWYKILTFYRKHSCEDLKELWNIIDIANWLSIARANLVDKNESNYFANEDYQNFHQMQIQQT